MREQIEKDNPIGLSPEARLIVLLDRLQQIIWDELEYISPGIRNPQAGMTKVVGKDSAEVKTIVSVAATFQQAEYTKIKPQSVLAKEMEIAQDFCGANLPQTANKKLDMHEAIASLTYRTYRDDNNWWDKIEQQRATYKFMESNLFAFQLYMEKTFKLGHYNYLIKDEWGEESPIQFYQVIKFYGLPVCFEWNGFWENYGNPKHYANDLELFARFYVSLHEKLKATLNSLSQPFDQTMLSTISSLSETCSRLLTILKWKVVHYQNEFQEEKHIKSWPEFGSLPPYYGPISDSGKCFFLAGLLGYFGNSTLAERIKKEILDSELIDLYTLGFDLKEYYRSNIETIKNEAAKKEQALLEKIRPLEIENAELAKEAKHLRADLDTSQKRITSLEKARDAAEEQLSTMTYKNQIEISALKKECSEQKEELYRTHTFGIFNKKEPIKTKNNTESPKISVSPIAK